MTIWYKVVTHNWPCRCLDCIGIQSVHFDTVGDSRLPEHPSSLPSALLSVRVKSLSLRFCSVSCVPCASMLCVCVKSHSLRLCSVWVCVSLHLCSLHQAHLLAHNKPALLFSGWTALQWVGDPNLKHKELKTFTQKGTQRWWKFSKSPVVFCPRSRTFSYVNLKSVPRQKSFKYPLGRLKPVILCDVHFFCETYANIRRRKTLWRALQYDDKISQIWPH